MDPDCGSDVDSPWASEESDDSLDAAIRLSLEPLPTSSSSPVPVYSVEVDGSVWQGDGQSVKPVQVGTAAAAGNPHSGLPLRLHESHHDRRAVPRSGLEAPPQAEAGAETRIEPQTLSVFLGAASPGQQSLGIEIDHADGISLLVTALGRRGGRVQQWNEEHPNDALQVGDRIVEVNGVSGDASMLIMECCQPVPLRITLVTDRPRAQAQGGQGTNGAEGACGARKVQGLSTTATTQAEPQCEQTSNQGQDHAQDHCPESADQAEPTTPPTAAEATQPVRGVEEPPSRPAADNVELQLLAGAAQGSRECIDAALSRGADVDARDEDGNTVLLVLASYSSWRNCVKPLAGILRARPDVDAQNLLGETALQVAIRNQNMVFASKLLHCRANPSLQDQFGESPLAEAALVGSGKLVKMLLRRRADIAACMGGDVSNNTGTERGTKEAILPKFLVCEEVAELLQRELVTWRLEQKQLTEPPAELVRGFAPPSHHETDQEVIDRDRSAILHTHHIDRETYDLRNPEGSHSRRAHAEMAEVAARRAARKQLYEDDGPRMSTIDEPAPEPRPRLSAEERWQERGIFQTDGRELGGAWVDGGAAAAAMTRAQCQVIEEEEAEPSDSTQCPPMSPKPQRQLLALQDYPEVGPPFEEVQAADVSSSDGAVLTLRVLEGSTLRLVPKRHGVLLAELLAWINWRVSDSLGDWELLSRRGEAWKVVNRTSFPPCELTERDGHQTLEECGLGGGGQLLLQWGEGTMRAATLEETVQWRGCEALASPDWGKVRAAATARAEEDPVTKEQQKDETGGPPRARPESRWAAKTGFDGPFASVEGVMTDISMNREWATPTEGMQCGLVVLVYDSGDGQSALTFARDLARGLALPSFRLALPDTQFLPQGLLQTCPDDLSPQAVLLGCVLRDFETRHPSMPVRGLVGISSATAPILEAVLNPGIHTPAKAALAVHSGSWPTAWSSLPALQTSCPPEVLLLHSDAPATQQAASDLKRQLPRELQVSVCGARRERPGMDIESPLLSPGVNVFEALTNRIGPEHEAEEDVAMVLAAIAREELEGRKAAEAPKQADKSPAPAKVTAAVSPEVEERTKQMREARLKAMAPREPAWLPRPVDDAEQGDDTETQVASAWPPGSHAPAAEMRQSCSGEETHVADAQPPSATAGAETCQSRSAEETHAANAQPPSSVAAAAETCQPCPVEEASALDADRVARARQRAETFRKARERRYHKQQVGEDCPAKEKPVSSKNEPPGAKPAACSRSKDPDSDSDCAGAFFRGFWDDTHQVRQQPLAAPAPPHLAAATEEAKLPAKDGVLGAKLLELPHGMRAAAAIDDFVLGSGRKCGWY